MADLKGASLYFSQRLHAEQQAFIDFCESENVSVADAYFHLTTEMARSLAAVLLTLAKAGCDPKVLLEATCKQVRASVLRNL